MRQTIEGNLTPRETPGVQEWGIVPQSKSSRRGTFTKKKKKKKKKKKWGGFFVHKYNVPYWAPSNQHETGPTLGGSGKKMKKGRGFRGGVTGRADLEQPGIRGGSARGIKSWTIQKGIAKNTARSDLL